MCYFFFAEAYFRYMKGSELVDNTFVTEWVAGINLSFSLSQI